MKKVSVRIVKSEDCENCKTYLPRMRKQGYQFEVYDGDADENQDELDHWKVDVFPVVQIISRDEDGKVEVEFQFPPGKMPVARMIDPIKERVEKKYR